jgi:serine/threonine protein phosphatase PrpC
MYDCKEHGRNGGFLIIMRVNFIRYAVRSDVGRVRKNNEDNLFYCNKYMMFGQSDDIHSAAGECEAPAVFAVFDGIGGENNGEKASSIAAHTLSAFYNELCQSNPQNYNRVIDSYVASTNEAIGEQTKLIGSIMGTTAAIVIISQNCIYAYNIGDTRIYAYERGRLRQISIDHTLARKKIEANQYTYSEARRSYDWGKLTACLGIPKNNGEHDRISQLPIIQVKRKLRLLICSDGLSDMLSDEILARRLGAFVSPQNITKKLMSDALNMGGKDNISLIVLDICNKRFGI